MKEMDVLRSIQLALSEAGAVTWRNNCGSYTDPRSGSFVKFGIGNPGGSDLVGIYKGKFCAFEVKSAKGKATEAQLNFIAAVIRHGGIAGVVRSQQDALDLLRG